MDIPKNWIEAGARALQSSRMMQQYGHPAPPEAWDESPDYIREDWLKHATACLAAVFGRAEVVWGPNECGAVEGSLVLGGEEDSNGEGTFKGSADFKVTKGDALVIVRGC